MLLLTNEMPSLDMAIADLQMRGMYLVHGGRSGPLVCRPESRYAPDNLHGLFTCYGRRVAADSSYVAHVGDYNIWLRVPRYSIDLRSWDVAREGRYRHALPGIYQFIRSLDNCKHETLGTPLWGRCTHCYRMLGD